MPVRYPRPKAGSKAEEVDSYTKRDKHQTILAKSARKPQVLRAVEAVSLWFLLKAGIEPEVMKQGTQKECLDALVIYKRENPKDRSKVFVAHGVQIV